MRTYEGIFDYPATIYESLLSKFLGISAIVIKEQLLKLKQYHIVHYEPQNDKPQIILLRNRMYADSYKINIKDHLQRKQNYKARLEANDQFC